MKRMSDDTGEEKRKKLAGVFALVLIVLITLLFLNSMLQNRDGRRSIVSEEDGISYSKDEGTSEEIRLKNILECMSGVGEVRVMITEAEDSQTASVFQEEDNAAGGVRGIIVVAEGAENPVIRSRLTEAVATACGVSPSDVAVYEMSR